MNKIYLSIALLFVFVLASAQTMKEHPMTNTKLVPVAQKYAKAQIQRFNNSQKSTTERWFYQPGSYNIFNPNGNFEDYYKVTIFPDTTMMESSNVADGHIFQHSMAVSIEPSSTIFELGDGSDWNKNTMYSVDSVDFTYLYSRNTASNIVDTLVVQIQVNTWRYHLLSSDESWVQSVFGVSEMNVPVIFHDPLSWRASSADANVIYTKKVPLTVNDTTSMPKSLLFSIDGVTLTGGDVVKASFTFVPGYSWTANSDSIQMYNEFSYLTYGNESASIFPYYTEDYNSNQVLRTWAYRDNTDDAYEPVYFFITDPYPFQYHDVAIKLTALNTSIDANAANLNVGQNQPNPFNGISTINYSLENAANVNVTVYNVAGAEIMNIEEGLKTAGNHKVQINSDNLPAGIYYYTFTADNYRVTKKMIVY